MAEKCPVCGHRLYTHYRSFGDPDKPGWCAYEITECVKCGFKEEKEVS